MAKKTKQCFIINQGLKNPTLYNTFNRTGTVTKKTVPVFSPSLHVPIFKVPAACRNARIHQAKLGTSNLKKELAVIRLQPTTLETHLA